MKKNFVWLLGVFVACCFTLTALAACGDDDDDPQTASGNGEVCIVAILPNAIAQNANLEVTYNDGQGSMKNFTVRNGESSDALTTYSKEGLQLLQLMGGFTVDATKCIIRTVKFAAPVGTKVTCKYEMVLNGVEATEFPAKVYSPFAVATGKRPSGEALVVQGISTFSQSTLSSLEQYKVWLERRNGVEHENFVTVE